MSKTKINAVDDEFGERLLEWVGQNRGMAWMQAAYDDFHEDFEDVDTAEAWFWQTLLYHYGGEEDDEQTVLEEFLSENPPLSPAEYALAQAHREARVSIFAVADKRPGAVQLEDLVCPTRLWVPEPGELELNTLILARVGKVVDQTVLLGCYPRSLPRSEVDPICDRLRAVARHQQVNLSAELLRQPAWVMEMTLLWRSTLEAD